MGFLFVFLVALLCLAVVGSCYASMPAEIYWNSVFPNTPMPKSLQDLLGRLMKLPGFTKTENRATFLPRAVADSMPFSSNKFSDILKLFSMEPKSAGTKVMKQNIDNCERESIEGEDKYCATSLESLIDHSVSRLGKKIQVLSTEVEKETKVEKFTIGKDKTDVYRVPLVGSDGTKVKATAVCHKDTSAWNPKHSAFQVLKVKPGSVPICHFLAKETNVWVPN
ncbi:hypothetical protein SLA2020_241660 [Shorea laevis]